MIPKTVCFTGLEFDPMEVLQPRCVTGVIPLDWRRHHFSVENAQYLTNLHRWLTNNMEERWAVIYHRHGGIRAITLAFENDLDAMTFVMAGAAEWQKEEGGRP